MSNRQYRPPVGGLIPEVVTLEGELVFGGSSAVGSTTYFPGGTWTKNAAGDWSLTLADGYNKLVGATAIYNVNSATPTDLVPSMYSNTVGTTNIIKFKLLTGTVATDPGNGASMFVTLKLRRGSDY